MNLHQSYTKLPSHFYKVVLPTPVHEPQLVIWNDQLAKELNLERDAQTYTELLSGKAVPENIQPIAQAYAGHQFGNFTMLGDGRAILLGEIRLSDGSSRDIQLKGSGRTPYSRGGDGRAALGPMLREYIISEAMHHLDVPTTRSLAVVYTGEGVQRETVKPGGILTRVARHHIRVGTFQYANQFGQKSDVQDLADYTIERMGLPMENNEYSELLKEVIRRQAHLIAKWQLLGFVHGVMNTDNMATSGETIDYGPCAFIDTYDPGAVFSSIDRQGRYAYGNQPGIGGWNLARFAESLLPLFDENQEKAIEKAQTILDSYPEEFQQAFNKGLVQKIGFMEPTEKTVGLATELLEIMEEEKADFTLSFRSLTLGTPKTEAVFRSTKGQEWLGRWEKEIAELKLTEVRSIMQQSNPAIIPRNHLVQQALDEAEETGSLDKFVTLLKQLERPYEYRMEQLTFNQLPPDSNEPFVTYCGT